MANMVAPSLSAMQFGSTQPTVAQSPATPKPTSAFMQQPHLPGAPQPLNMHQPHQQHEDVSALSAPTAHLPAANVTTPLPAMAGDFGSVKSAAVWRKPAGQVMPLGRGTFGSVFNPFGTM